jgi:hypothetical protein
MSGEGRTTPEQALTRNELRGLVKPGDTITTASGYDVQMIQDDKGRLLFQSRSSRETATSVGQPPSLSIRKTLMSVAEPPTVFG